MQHFFQDKFRDLGKRDRTRGILADGIIRVIAQAGREGLSARRIAAETGLSVGTVYNHFKTMEEAHQFAAECILIETMQAAGKATEGLKDPAELYVVATRSVLDRLLENVSWARVVGESLPTSDMLEDEIAAGLARGVALGNAQGVFRAEPNPVLFRHLGETIFTAVRGKDVFGASERARRETCEIGLRILGMDVDAARCTVETVFARPG